MKNTPQTQSGDEHVLTLIRQRIVRRLTPGDRLPTTRQLAAELDTSHATAQRAVRTLAGEGFLLSDGRRGTFVREHPPHRSKYAIVYPVQRGAVAESYLWSAIQNAAADYERDHTARFQFHYDVEHHRTGEDYQALLADIETDRIAGLIFTYNPSLLGPSPLLTRPALPRVGIMQPVRSQPMPAVYPDREVFIERAITQLASQGRKRLAVFSLPDPHGTPRHDPLVLASAKRHGLELRSHWYQYGVAGRPQVARQIAMLLMNQAAGNRPDAMLILDDHLAGPVAEGLIASGVTAMGRTLGVVTLANFPQPPPNPLHFDLLGFDAPALLAACVERIDQQRTGAAAPPVTMLPPRFSFESAAVARTRSVQVR